jgi:hypothetical protein
MDERRSTVKSDPSLLERFQKIYATYKKWIVYAYLILILILIYLGDFLGSWREDLLPVAVVSVLAVIFETIQSLKTKVSQCLRPREFPTLAEALPMLSEVVGRARNKITVEIIAAAGGTTITTILPRIIESTSASRIDVTLLLVDSGSEVAQWFPEHWCNEVRMNVTRIRNEIRDQRLRIKVYTYSNLPCLHGIRIDKTHLMLGFFGWNETCGKPELSRAERRPHLYFTKEEPGSEYFFDLFENWLERVPRHLIFSYAD